MTQNQNYLSVAWIGVLAIILAISGPWFDLAVSNHSFVKTYIGGIGIGILVLMTLWKQHYHKELAFHISYLKLFLGTTFALGLLSVLWSNNPDFSITKLLIWVTAFMAFYVAYKMDITEENLRKLAFYLVIAGGIIAFIGILQYLFDAFVPQAGAKMGMTQAANPSSTFGNKNMATQPISMVFPLVAFLILSKNSSVKVMWIAGTLGALMIAFNFYTSTRASWVAISVEVIMMTTLLIIKRKSFSEFASWNKQKLIIVLTSLAIFFTLINFNSDGFAPMSEKASANFTRLTTDIQNDKSLRYQIWTVAGEMVEDAPLFGTGLGTWFHNLVNEGYSTYVINYVQRVHNDLLEMAVEIGLIGLGVFFLAVIAILVALWKIISQKDTRYLLFYFALFESLTGSFANLQFSFPYQLAMPALIFGLWMGLIAKKSEEFIRPIKEFRFKLNKPELAQYKNTILAINGVIFITISSLYISWANLYSTLNQINLTRDFDKLEKTVNTSVYHLEIQNIMNFLTSAYLQSGDYNVAEKITTTMLKYWPNDYVTLSRYSLILQQKGEIDKAIEVAKKAFNVGPKNSHFSTSLLFNLYFQTKQYDKYIALFNEINKEKPEYIADNPQMYPMLIQSALRIRPLLKTIPIMRDNNMKYNGYNCNIESNMVYSYLLDNNFEKLKPAFEREIKRANNCMSPNIIKEIEKKLNQQ